MTEVEKLGFTNDWSISTDRPGYVEKTFVHKNVASVIYRPILSPEERAKRMKLLGEAAADLVLSTLEAKARKAREAKKNA